ncbi:MAG: hypothetical protein ACKPKO_12205, partial [Candidatus Fonsibacter sp.]
MGKNQRVLQEHTCVFQAGPNTKAAEARGLYKFGLQLAQELVQLAPPPGDVHANSVRALFNHLHECVDITKATPLDVQAAVHASNDFC